MRAVRRRVARGLLATGLVIAAGATACTPSTGQIDTGQIDAGQIDPEPAASASESVMATPGQTVAPFVAPELEPTSAPLPLAGVTIVIDPGHQLGNQYFPAEVNALVDAGFGVTKACNTTGTAALDGTAEATVNWEVAALAVDALTARGAEVVMTREENSTDAWGPCIDVRGGLGNGEADLLVSIHADGADAQHHGFHLLLPGTDREIHAESLRLAEELRDALVGAGMTPATYVAEAMRASNEYGTLNHSTKPAVIIELGNLRNPADSALLTGAEGQATAAEAIADAVEAWLRG